MKQEFKVEELLELSDDELMSVVGGVELNGLTDNNTLVSFESSSNLNSSVQVTGIQGTLVGINFRPQGTLVGIDVRPSNGFL